MLRDPSDAAPTHTSCYPMYFKNGDRLFAFVAPNAVFIVRPDAESINNKDYGIRNYMLNGMSILEYKSRRDVTQKWPQRGVEITVEEFANLYECKLQAVTLDMFPPCKGLSINFTLTKYAL